MNPTNETDDSRELERLLFAIADRDGSAFRRLHDLCAARLYSIVVSMLRNDADAADVLQTVFISIWRRAGQFDPAKGGAKTWLAAIARNAGIDAIRQRRADHVSDDVCAELPCARPIPIDAVKHDNTRRAVVDGVMTLPENQRSALTLFYLEERPLTEVAGILGAPLNTTKSWVRRGLVRLQSDFAGQRLADFV